ncbi:hypothetical protein PCPL58_0112 [Pseudomonas cerasi]|uniref:Uncharacterized protein n=1 Tax=Pseudomonas cerasi TaxID=1583341 RepID=A0A193SI03_9PSED|nr:hypothetical protein PCPL58_0112 [Pseudomonas cerasi]SOS14107.1 hypothetical protein PL963_00114 [Pseudomonas cerasi]
MFSFLGLDYGLMCLELGIDGLIRYYAGHLSDEVAQLIDSRCSIVK